MSLIDVNDKLDNETSQFMTNNDDRSNNSGDFDDDVRNIGNARSLSNSISESVDSISSNGDVSEVEIACAKAALLIALNIGAQMEVICDKLAANENWHDIVKKVSETIILRTNFDLDNEFYGEVYMKSLPRKVLSDLFDSKLQKNQTLEDLPWLQIIKNSHLNAILPINLRGEIYGSHRESTFIDVITKTHKGGVRNINFFAIGAYYDTFAFDILYEMFKTIGDEVDNKKQNCKEHVILKIPTATGIEWGFNKRSINYDHNDIIREQFNCISAPGFKGHSANNNKFNVKAADALEYLTMDESSLIEEKDHVRLSNKLQGRIKDTRKYFEKYSKFVAAKKKEMKSFCASIEQTKLITKDTKQILDADCLIDEALHHMCRCTPVGLIYISVLCALLKEYTSNYDSTKKNTSGYSYDTTTYPSAYTTTQAIPVAIRNNYFIS